jgi:hypothetical protein
MSHTTRTSLFSRASAREHELVEVLFPKLSPDSSDSERRKQLVEQVFFDRLVKHASALLRNDGDPTIVGFDASRNLFSTACDAVFRRLMHERLRLPPPPLGEHKLSGHVSSFPTSRYSSTTSPVVVLVNTPGVVYFDESAHSIVRHRKSHEDSEVTDLDGVVATIAKTLRSWEQTHKREASAIAVVSVHDDAMRELTGIAAAAVEAAECSDLTRTPGFYSIETPAFFLPKRRRKFDSYTIAPRHIVSKSGRDAAVVVSKIYAERTSRTSHHEILSLFPSCERAGICHLVFGDELPDTHMPKTVTEAVAEAPTPTLSRDAFRGFGRFRPQRALRVAKIPLHHTANVRHKETPGGINLPDADKGDASPEGCDSGDSKVTGLAATLNSLFSSRKK